jgi:phosphonate transport system substrate-binding protein
MIAAAAATLMLTATAASAQSWQEQYSELTFAVIPSENASTTTNRYGPLTEYLSEQLGVPVTLRVANDYAAVIEGQRAGNIHIAMYGPASYARAVMTGVEVDPLVVPVHENGAAGYYSVLWVLADSPYQTMDDLAGKAIALVDPNSTSGNNAPRFFLDRDGYSVDTFFGQNFFAGSHENALLALVQGTADVAANSWNTETDSNLTRMIDNGALVHDDGTPYTAEEFRVIYKSDFLPEGPYSVLGSLPDDLKDAIRTALLEMPANDRAAFDALSDGKDREFLATTPADFQPIIDMVTFNDNARRS